MLQTIDAGHRRERYRHITQILHAYMKQDKERLASDG